MARHAGGRSERRGPSRPGPGSYAYKKRFYQDPAVAARYDEDRWSGPADRWRDRRDWARLRRALAGSLAGEASAPLALDVPCGTGRFVGRLTAAGFRVVGADISRPMIHRARERMARETAGAPHGDRVLGWVQADAEALPFRDGAFDALVCMRFGHHAPPGIRARLLAELGRVSRRLAVDYRHRYAWRWLRWQVSRLLGFRPPPLERVSLRGLRAELRTAGLEARRIVPGPPPFSDKWVVLAEGDGSPRPRPGRLPVRAASEVRALRRLGAGGRSTAWAGEWRGRQVVLKVYRPGAVLRHAGKHPLPISEFAWRRNSALRSVPGLAGHVAEPLGWIHAPGLTATLQARLHGRLYYFWRKEHPGASLEVPLRRVIQRAHQAGFHDVDLHAMNVMVVEGDAGPRPVLFDFDLIPFTERPPNPLVGLLLRLGILGPASRDLRKLRRLDDFRRVERKILPRYRAAAARAPLTPPP